VDLFAVLISAGPPLASAIAAMSVDHSDTQIRESNFPAICFRRKMPLVWRNFE
jgi:hypothetical protein